MSCAWIQFNEFCKTRISEQPIQVKHSTSELLCPSLAYLNILFRTSFDLKLNAQTILLCQTSWSLDPNIGGKHLN